MMTDIAQDSFEYYCLFLYLLAYIEIISCHEGLYKGCEHGPWARCENVP